MRYKQFYPEDKVITIVDYDGIPSATLGKIDSRWAGTVYLLKLPNGTFRWLSDRSFTPQDHSGQRLKEGDYGVVTSDKRQKFAQVGEKLQVVKVAYDTDFYGVLIDEGIRWFLGFQLAPYL